MRRDSLLDFFADAVASPSDFLIHDDGYRSRTFSFATVAELAHAFARQLRSAGISKQSKVLIWGENRPGWIVAFWGCLLEGVVVVPIDYRASPDLLRRVLQIVDGRGILVGEEVQLAPLDVDVPVWRLADLTADAALASGTGAPPAASDPRSIASPDDVAEIIFTSGATADPKGVVITHRNILANIVPVEREIHKYRKYGRPFFPLRFLNLLPLSHMFGQAMATFVPPMLPGTVVFMRGYNPAEIVRRIHRHKVSVLACVPKILDVLRDYIVRIMPETARAPTDTPHVAVRWWRYRKVHRLLGWKFWSFVVGAAPLDPELEAFWSRLGFLVVQGYGLTETAPIVTLNHPFKASRGTVGTPIAGVEVKLGSDGEILVRGDNVTTGYYDAPAETAGAFTDGWFHTGDIGTLDADGRLSVRGRKKELIVTPEGLNVFPDDVERVLNQHAAVRESSVVGVTTGGEERVHAVLRLEPGGVANDVVRAVNARLEDHQKIRGVSMWPDEHLPRTEGTRKLKRREIKEWVTSGHTQRQPSASASRDEPIESVVSRFAGTRAVTAETTLDELGLSSLERMELLMALEERYDGTIDELAFSAAATVSDLQRLVERPAGAPGPPDQTAERFEFPDWNRRGLARFIRRVSLPTWILPLARLFAWCRVEGRSHLKATTGPVIFAANHQSHFDAPVLLSALPARWRYRVAPAMAKEFFKAHFFPHEHTRRERFANSLNYYLAALFFNAFPLPQREAGTRQTLRYIGELVSDGFCPLIFPEGRRAESGEIARFQPGIGMIAARLDVPVIPVRLDGTGRVLSPSWRMARPGRVRVAFGAPMRLTGDDYPALARRVEEAVKHL